MQMSGLDFPFGLFNIVSVLFPIMFLVVLGIIISVLVRGARQASRNNAQPRVAAPARVVAKRTEVSHRHHGGNAHLHSSSTTYYATFEFMTGDRLELHVPGDQFGMLAEGDQGMLTSQGTRFLGFQRQQL